MSGGSPPYLAEMGRPSHAPPPSPREFDCGAGGSCTTTWATSPNTYLCWRGGSRCCSGGSRPRPRTRHTSAGAAPLHLQVGHSWLGHQRPGPSIMTHQPASSSHRQQGFSSSPQDTRTTARGLYGGVKTYHLQHAVLSALGGEVTGMVTQKPVVTVRPGGRHPAKHGLGLLRRH